MQPFEKHRADLGELETCGSQLRTQAAAAIENGGLTRQAYQPAIANWDGMGAPELAAAQDPLQRSCGDASHALAWASVVAGYWAGTVRTFNNEVDTIVSSLNRQGPHYGATGEDGEPPTEDAIDEARAAAESEARRQWWRVYNTHILDGGDRVEAMLRDGPTQEHVSEARRVGVLPPEGWTPGFGPPSGGSAWFNGGQWGLWGLGVISSGLDPGAGFAARHYQGLAQGARTSWLMSSMAAMHYGQMEAGTRQRAGGYYTRNGTWVPRRWQPRAGMRGTYYGAMNSRFAATSAAQQFADDAAAAGRSGSRWATAGRVARVGGPVTSFASGAWDQWSQDTGRTDVTTDERAARATTRGALVAGGAAAGAWAGAKGGALAGAAIGSIIPGVGTGVGAAVGGVVGGIVGGVVGSGLANEVADVAVEGVSEAWDGVKSLFG